MPRGLEAIYIPTIDAKRIETLYTAGDLQKPRFCI